MSSSLRLLRSLGKSYMAASNSLRGGSRVLSAATTVRVRSYSDESIRDHRITGGSYDGPGKTTVTVLNQDMPLLMLDAYSPTGFRLNNGMRVIGPVAIFPTCVLSWIVPAGAADVTRESLSLFKIVHPRPEIVYVGLGDADEKYDMKLAMELRKAGHNFQFMATEHAISSYNFMAAEGRVVAAALIPPRKMESVSDDDAFGTAYHNKTMLEYTWGKGGVMGDDHADRGKGWKKDN